MKRRLLIIAICLLGGAVVNVAVAWGLSMWSGDPIVPPWSTVWVPDDDPILVWLRQRGWRPLPDTGGRLSRVARLASRETGLEREWFVEDTSPGVISLGPGPLFSDGRPRPAPSARISAWWTFLHAVRAGWPAESMSGIVVDHRAWRRSSIPPSGRGASSLHFDGCSGFSGFNTSHALMVPTSPRRFLPLRPLWPGFTINTLLYAAVLWLLICGPFALRRFLRVRRGLCPKCAYPMGESSVCTECGCGLRARTA